MNLLFSLSISCITSENYWAEYPIRLFATAEEIDVVVKRLMSNRENFSKDNCKVRIEEVKVVGERDNVECVLRQIRKREK